MGVRQEVGGYDTAGVYDVQAAQVLHVPYAAAYSAGDWVHTEVFLVCVQGDGNGACTVADTGVHAADYRVFDFYDRAYG